jgi:hypothetical protein
MKRTREFVLEEYDDRWAACLDKSSIEEARMAMIHHAVADPGEVISNADLMEVFYRGHMLEISAKALLQLVIIEQQRIFRTLVRSGFRFCELGCGIGWNLSHFPCDIMAYGGELTPMGIQVAKEHDLAVTPFDFYEPRSYRIIRPDSVVFTVHAIEQLPDATPFLEGIRAAHDRPREVWHFEPYWIPRVDNEEERNTYLRDRDYNQNLGQLLHGADDIDVFHVEHDVLGHWQHPFHITGWRFK